MIVFSYQTDFRLPTGLEGRKQYHIQCSAGDIAPVVLVPGDQNRVSKIIKHMEKARKVAENRGLITYTGTYKGFTLSVTSTGMGGPSASIVYEELINVGARILIRVGSVAGLQKDINEGDIVVPYACVRDDGVTNYYIPENFPAVVSPPVYWELMNAAEQMGVKVKTGIHWTHSYFYSRSAEYFQRWHRVGIISMDMEASALFVIAHLRNVMAGFVGVCYANRFLQTENGVVDLSVPDINRSHIQNSEEKAIIMTLNAAINLYRQLDKS
jgi:uridine phosphorylase